MSRARQREELSKYTISSAKTSGLERDNLTTLRAHILRLQQSPAQSSESLIALIPPTAPTPYALLHGSELGCVSKWSWRQDWQVSHNQTQYVSDNLSSQQQREYSPDPMRRRNITFGFSSL
jgi:hypothetical protein